MIMLEQISIDFAIFSGNPFLLMGVDAPIAKKHISKCLKFQKESRCTSTSCMPAHKVL
jgi:hypothetical protein